MYETLSLIRKIRVDRIVDTELQTSESRQLLRRESSTSSTSVVSTINLSTPKLEDVKVFLTLGGLGELTCLLQRKSSSSSLCPEGVRVHMQYVEGVKVHMQYDTRNFKGVIPHTHCLYQSVDFATLYRAVEYTTGVRN